MMEILCHKTTRAKKLLIHENLTKRDFAIRLGRHHVIAPSPRHDGGWQRTDDGPRQRRARHHRVSVEARSVLQRDRAQGYRARAGPRQRTGGHGADGPSTVTQP